MDATDIAAHETRCRGCSQALFYHDQNAPVVGQRYAGLSAPFRGLATLIHARSLAGYITIASGFRSWVHRYNLFTSRMMSEASIADVWRYRDTLGVVHPMICAPFRGLPRAAGSKLQGTSVAQSQVQLRQAHSSAPVVSLRATQEAPSRATFSSGCCYSCRSQSCSRGWQRKSACPSWPYCRRPWSDSCNSS